MSSSLVRKSLEIVESETVSRAQPSKKTRKHDSIRLNSKKKVSQKLSNRVLGDTKSEAALQVELARRLSSVKQDKTSENLKRLVTISSSKSVNFSRAQKIFEQTVRRSKPSDEPAPEKNSSAFTEEDFKKFEEEYFVS